jgi:hypothetical protein
MSNAECYRTERQYDEATKTRLAAEKDLESSSPNASPLAVRSARFETAKREQAAAREILVEHRRTCPICKAKVIPG